MQKTQTVPTVRDFQCNQMHLTQESNQKVENIIVTEVTVRSSFITYSSQNPWNFLDREVIMIKEDDKCLSPFQLKSIRVTFLQ